MILPQKHHCFLVRSRAIKIIGTHQCEGFECIGTVVAKGHEVKRLNVGDYAYYGGSSCFAEYVVCNENLAFKLPALMPEVLALFTSGMTASIGLNVTGEMKTKETVLVTGIPEISPTKI